MKEFKTFKPTLVFQLSFWYFCASTTFVSGVEVAGMEEKRKAYLKKTFCGISVFVF